MVTATALPFGDAHATPKPRKGTSFTDASRAVACPWPVAQAIARVLVTDRKVEIVFDACAGQGTNTLAFADAGARGVYAFESRPDRAKLVTYNMKTYAPGFPVAVIPSALTRMPDLPKGFEERTSAVFFDWVHNPNLAPALIDTDPLPTFFAPDMPLPDYVTFRLSSTQAAERSSLAPIARFPEDDTVLLVVSTTELSLKKIRKKLSPARRVSIDEERNAIQFISPRSATPAPEESIEDTAFRSFLSEFLSRFIPSDQVVQGLVTPDQLPLWWQSFTTSDENVSSNYELNEYIGDRLLEAPFIISVLSRYPNASLNALTNLKTSTLTKSWQGARAREWGFGSFIRLGPWDREPTLTQYEDVFEAFCMSLFFAGESIKQGLGFLLLLLFTEWMIRDVSFDVEGDLTNPVTSTLTTLTRLGIAHEETDSEDAETGKHTFTIRLFDVPAAYKLRSVLGVGTGRSKASARKKAFEVAAQALASAPLPKQATGVVDKGTPLPELDDAAQVKWEKGAIKWVRSTLKQVFPESVVRALTQGEEKKALWESALEVGSDPLAYGQLGLLGRWLLEEGFVLWLLQYVTEHDADLDEDAFSDIKTKYFDKQFIAETADTLGFGSVLRPATAEELDALGQTEDVFARFGKGFASRAEFEAARKRHGSFATPVRSISLRRSTLASALSAFTAVLYTTGEQTSQGLGFLLVREWTRWLVRDLVIPLNVQAKNPVTVLQQLFEQLRLDKPVEQKTDVGMELVVPATTLNALNRLGIPLRNTVLGKGVSEDAYSARQLAYNAAIDAFTAAGLTRERLEEMKQRNLLRFVSRATLKEADEAFPLGWRVTVQTLPRQEKMIRFIGVAPGEEREERVMARVHVRSDTKVGDQVEGLIRDAIASV